ncbi:MAG: hypothetical protein ACXVEF_09340 [Polyangiales bacterium]
MTALLVLLTSCVAYGGGTSGAQIDCSGLVCDWQTVEGDVRYGTTWHEGDRGVNMSGGGRAVTEQRVVLIPPFRRQLRMTAAMLRDAEVSLTFEFAFFAPGSAPGATFWDRSPVPLATRTVEVPNVGVFNFQRDVLVPSEGAAVIVRIIKEGSGRALVDEFTFG